MDKIIIRNLEIFAYNGVYKEENVLGQKFIISAILYTNTKMAGLNDDLDYSTNYGEVCHFINEYMKNNTFKLIETVAENLAKEILKKFDKVLEIELEIKKPWAPILLHFKNVAVNIKRSWHNVYLGVGSNLGDKKGYLDFAKEKLEQDENIKFVKSSSYIDTKPVGDVVQDDFLNACFEIKTLYSPEELLDRVNLIEKEAKRERKIHWGPRTLDIDILFFDDIILMGEKLTIPHKEIQNREFVLKPLKEIAPYYIHPVFKKSIIEMLNNL